MVPRENGVSYREPRHNEAHIATEIVIEINAIGTFVYTHTISILKISAGTCPAKKSQKKGVLTGLGNGASGAK